MADTIRQFHSHDDARILLHRSDDAEIDLFRESRRPQTFSLIVLKEPDPDSWDGEEEQQGETKRAGSHGVGGPEEAQRQSREWCDRWCWWRDVIRMTRLFFLFVHQVIEKQGPDTDDQIDEEERGVPDLSRQRGGCQERNEADGIEMQKITPQVEVGEFVHQE